MILPSNLKILRLKFSGFKKSVVHYFQGFARFRKVPMKDQDFQGQTKNPHPQKFQAIYVVLIVQCFYYVLNITHVINKCTI